MAGTAQEFVDVLLNVWNDETLGKLGLFRGSDAICHWTTHTATSMHHNRNPSLRKKILNDSRDD
jgi:hypothetical protein